MKIKFYSRDKKNNFSDNHICEGDVKYGNIFPINDTNLPNNNDDCVNFAFDYSKAYSDVSKKKVNVRFRYPYGGTYRLNNIEGTEEIFAKLNGFQRIRLSFINKQTYLHKNPVLFFATIGNIIFGMVNILIAIINFNLQNDINQTATPMIKEQSETNKKQLELLRESINNNDELIKLMNIYLKDIESLSKSLKDTLN